MKNSLLGFVLLPTVVALFLISLQRASSLPLTNKLQLRPQTRMNVATPFKNNFSTDEKSAPIQDQDWLDFTASKWKMTCYDADDGIFGLDTIDPSLGVEVQKINIPTSGGLGLNLIEYMRPVDRRKMVLIESIAPNSHADASQRFKVGDTISFVNEERTEGLDLDDTLDVLSTAVGVTGEKQASTVTLVIKRLVARETVSMTFVDSDNEAIMTSNVLTGSNLRSEMQKRNIQGLLRSTCSHSISARRVAGLIASLYNHFLPCLRIFFC
jgi:hypothetical protein